jgi:hypothetical protein
VDAVATKMRRPDARLRLMIENARAFRERSGHPSPPRPSRRSRPTKANLPEEAAAWVIAEFIHEHGGFEQTTEAIWDALGASVRYFSSLQIVASNNFGLLRREPSIHPQNGKESIRKIKDLFRVTLQP